MSNKTKKGPLEELEEAARQSDRSIAYEFWDFLKQSKKWWLIPLLVALTVLGALVVLGSSGLAPFIYSLF